MCPLATLRYYIEHRMSCWLLWVSHGPLNWHEPGPHRRSAYFLSKGNQTHILGGLEIRGTAVFFGLPGMETPGGRHCVCCLRHCACGDQALRGLRASMGSWEAGRALVPEGRGLGLLGTGAESLQVGLSGLPFTPLVTWIPLPCAKGTIPCHYLSPEGLEP